ncbi:MAG: hypothetical protein L3J09_02610 [Flavobacteriaceae bacterium]|nr:hypothetical protein [Flavobacteriaceae bacterium]
MLKYKSKITVIIKTKEVCISIYERIAIVEISEGKTVNFKTGYKTLIRLLSIIGDKPWIYISNRVNSYSLDPNDYKYLNMIPTLKGIGVVQYKERESTVVIEIEKMFIKKPLQTFDDLDSAIYWGVELLKK